MHMDNGARSQTWWPATPIFAAARNRGNTDAAVSAGGQMHPAHIRLAKRS
jgi:hypothetical protein